MADRGKIVVVLAGFAALVVIAVLVFHRPGQGEDGGGGPDGFNDCISKMVPHTSSHDNGFNIEVSTKLLAAVTGRSTPGAGDGGALKIGLNAADREAYQLLSESTSRSIIDGCIQHFNRSAVPPLNGEVQVWTRINEQPVDGVVVQRKTRPGDTCTTQNGWCLLTIHNLISGQSEAFVAIYNGTTSYPDAIPPETIAKGAVDVDLTPTSFRHIKVMNGNSPLAGAYVTVIDADVSKKVRNADCVQKRRFGSDDQYDCAKSDTGADGQAARFVFAKDTKDVSTFQVQVDYKKEEHVCTASSRGEDFVVSWAKCTSPVPQPKASQCLTRTLDAVRAVLSSAKDRTKMTAAATTVRFEIQGRTIKDVEAAPDSDLSQLAIKTLQAGQSIDKQGSPAGGSCIGQLSWTSH
jgi:hypothetical protein